MQPSSRSSGSLHTPTDPLFFRYIHLPGTWTPGGHPRAFQAGDEPSSRFQTPRISNPGTGIPATGVSTPSMENDRRVAYVRDAPSKEPVNHMHTSIEIRIHLPLQCRIIVHGRGLLESRGVPLPGTGCRQNPRGAKGCIARGGAGKMIQPVMESLMKAIQPLENGYEPLIFRFCYPGRTSGSRFCAKAPGKLHEGDGIMGRGG